MKRASPSDLFDSLPRGIAPGTFGQDRDTRALAASSNTIACGRLTYALEAAHNIGPWDCPEKFHREHRMGEARGNHDAIRA